MRRPSSTRFAAWTASNARRPTTTGRVTIEGGADDADVRAAVEEAGYTLEESG